MTEQSIRIRNSGWLWVPCVYFNEGLPFAVATVVSMIIFTGMGMSNSAMTFWTGIIGLPWSLKFLWAPILDAYGTKRAWMLSAQLLIACCFAMIACAFRMEHPAPKLIVALFFFTAFVSATHDIAADGYYMLALDSHGQAMYSGLRNVFYKCAMLAGQGGLVLFAGKLTDSGMPKNTAWMWAMFAVSAVSILVFVFLLFTAPAETVISAPGEKRRGAASVFYESGKSFLLRKGAVSAVVFLFFYRFAEAQLGKISVPFLIGSRESGGLGISLSDFGILFGTCGMICFLTGGFLAGLAVSRHGLGKCFLPMALAMNVPDIVYVILSYTYPSLTVSGVCIALEQFGYGFGYMAHVLFMVQFAEKSGEFRTTHFAFMTGLTILGMTLIGMLSGSVQELFASISGGNAALGYRCFFLWICLCTIPSFISVFLVRRNINPDFGKKNI